MKDYFRGMSKEEAAFLRKKIREEEDWLRKKQSEEAERARKLRNPRTRHLHEKEGLEQLKVGSC